MFTHNRLQVVFFSIILILSAIFARPALSALWSTPSAPDQGYIRWIDDMSSYPTGVVHDLQHGNFSSTQQDGLWYVGDFGAPQWDNLDGTQNLSPPGYSGPTYALHRMSYTLLIIGGKFYNSYTGDNNISMYNMQTGAQMPFYCSTADFDPSSEAVYAIAYDGGNYIYVGGDFHLQTVFDGSNLARCNMSTNQWEGLPSEAGYPPNNPVWAFHLLGGNLYVGGDFYNFSVKTGDPGNPTHEADFFALLDSSGDWWSYGYSSSTPDQGGAPFVVRAIDGSTADSIVVGGLGGFAYTVGTTDLELVADLQNSGEVWDLEVTNSSPCWAIVGGQFQVPTTRGHQVANLACWTGPEQWTELVDPSPADASGDVSVRAIHLHSITQRGSEPGLPESPEEYIVYLGGGFQNGGQNPDIDHLGHLGHLAFEPPPAVQKISIVYDPDAHRYRPQVAYNSWHHEYLAVWHNTWDNGNRYVYARRLDKYGQPVAPPFALSYILVDQVHPNVAYNPIEDEYLVVWMYDISGNNTRYEIWGSIIPWNASAPGTAIQIGTMAAPNNHWHPSVAWSSASNQYLVMWDSYLTGSTTSPQNISYRQVAADGSLGGIETLTIVNDPNESDLAYNPATEEYFVVWSRDQNDGSGNNDIYGAILNDDGSIKTSPFQITNQAHDQVAPAIATNQGDLYLVVWQEKKDLAVWNIWGAYLDVTGALTGDEIEAWGSVDYTLPDVACYGGQEWMLVFQAAEQLGKAIWMSTEKLDDPLDTSLYKVGAFNWHYRTPAVASGLGFQVVYEGRSGDAGSRQHIYGSNIWRGAVYLPLVMK